MDVLARARQACDGFDCDSLNALAQEVNGYVFDGISVSPYFSKAASLAEDFEYDEARHSIEQFLTDLENVQSSKKDTGASESGAEQ